MTALLAAVAVMALSVGAVPAQSDAAKTQADAAKTFDHYEAIRVALAADELKGVEQHATALAPMAAALAGAEARQAAEAVGKASDIKIAREKFGLLSAALLPAFHTARLKNVHLFSCGMVNQTWAQRGQAVENPYMGKSMLACGSPWEPKK